ncbi:MAG: hypothetical protein IPH07_16800 [Deltaproteobacteria bacterium]|nr:hypothetical protein [Deltaproteobacteria bacterium]MBK8239426.1 hypothetical protein [Deltaproteobacteria bacterium]MBK8719217.1 hypothetical protein [Deltaproteobacteria bacterium]MBP7287588.1 hypothetical protein [Nannocystaceae bacterium]
MLRRTALCLLLAGTALACDSDPTEPVKGREALAPLVGRTIELTLAADAVEPALVDAIAKHVEVATGAESIRVRVEHADDGTPASLTIDAWGRTTTTDEAIAAGLRGRFAQLATSAIAISPAVAVAPEDRLPAFAVDPDEDADAARTRLTEELRAQGVAGEIDVAVEDDEEGRREVRVQVRDERHE